MEETLSDWVRERAIICLVLRMNLIHESLARPGSEGVEARLVSYHWDDDGPVMADIHYWCFENSAIGYVDAAVEARENRFPGLVDKAIEQWTTAEWQQKTDVVIRYKSHPIGAGLYRWDNLGPSNLLVLQHLARLQGAIGQAMRGGPGQEADWSAVMSTTASRLQSMIALGNNELSRLTRMI